MKQPTGWEELTDHNVQKLGTEEGDITQIGTLRLTWKARGEKIGFQFGVYESELPPSAGIPSSQASIRRILLRIGGQH